MISALIRRDTDGLHQLACLLLNPVFTSLLCCITQGVISRGLYFPGSSVPWTCWIQPLRGIGRRSEGVSCSSSLFAAMASSPPKFLLPPLSPLWSLLLVGDLPWALKTPFPPFVLVVLGWQQLLLSWISKLPHCPLLAFSTFQHLCH